MGIGFNRPAPTGTAAVQQAVRKVCRAMRATGDKYQRLGADALEGECAGVTDAEELREIISSANCMGGPLEGPNPPDVQQAIHELYSIAGII